VNVDGVGCKNPAPAGPFGGCAAVQMGDGNSTVASRGRNRRAVGIERFKRRGVLAGLDG
jgi:hypothetical protein